MQFSSFCRVHGDTRFRRNVVTFFSRKRDSIKYSRADSHFKMRSFFDFSGTNTFPIFRVCRWFWSYQIRHTLKRRKAVYPEADVRPTQISLNSVAAKASKLIDNTMLRPKRRYLFPWEVHKSWQGRDGGDTVCQNFQCAQLPCSGTCVPLSNFTISFSVISYLFWKLIIFHWKT